MLGQLRLGFFPNFKGADTLLMSGDTEAVSSLILDALPFVEALAGARVGRSAAARGSADGIYDRDRAGQRAWDEGNADRSRALMREVSTEANGEDLRETSMRMDSKHPEHPPLQAGRSW